MASTSKQTTSEELYAAPNKDKRMKKEELEVNNTVTILGTGDYGRGLAHRLVHTGYRVVVGSRYPSIRSLTARDKTLGHVEVTTVEEALQQSDVVFVALPADMQVQALVPHASALAGKILIDVSNGRCKRKNMSNAELLAEAQPLSHVVKAFNTVSAYSLSSGQGGSGEVYVASNHPYAREAVADIARNMGFTAVMSGGLAAARQLETAPLKLFRGWGMPLLVSLIIWVGWAAYGTWRYHVKKGLDWSRWPINTLNKFHACTALTLLSMAYLPGCLATVAQLVNGTKYRKFPGWLDRWMRMRKELGLIALWLACCHCVMSVTLMSPSYFSKWYDTKSVNIPVDQAEDIVVPIDVRMNWKGEVAILLGTMALSTMCVLGITSLPSVGSRLNWRQWNFVQSYMGHFCMAVAACHVGIKVVPYLHLKPFYDSVQGMSFLSMSIPCFVIGFRLLLVLPCFSIPIWRIRKGWERGNCCACAKDDPESSPDVEVVEGRVNTAYVVSQNDTFDGSL